MSFTAKKKESYEWLEMKSLVPKITPFNLQLFLSVFALFHGEMVRFDGEMVTIF
jgi:hypothetical protein